MVHLGKYNPRNLDAVRELFNTAYGDKEITAQALIAAAKSVVEADVDEPFQKNQGQR